MLNQKVDSIITQTLIDNALSYTDYRKLVDDLLAEDKSTGTNHSPAYLEYSRLNTHRMNRVDKTVEINEELQALTKGLKEEWIWLVLTEGWCGDAAQNVPVLNKLAKLNPNITLKFILRDENLDVMDQYLTNGGRSIPKLIILRSDTLEDVGTWGPRPEPVQQLMHQYKSNPKGLPLEELSIEIHKWYAKDKSVSLQKELKELISQCMK